MRSNTAYHTPRIGKIQTLVTEWHRLKDWHDVYYAANNRNVFVASTKEDIIVKELYFSTPVNHMG